MTRLGVFVSSFGYIGFFPIAPGTAGSAAGLVLYALIQWSGGARVVEPLAILALLAGGVWSGTIAERHFGTIDPGQVVIDEVAGMLITLAFIPVGWTGALAGFVIFRFYDVVKPYPSQRLEKLAGGVGVMADDVMAAIYGNVTLRALIWLAPGWVA
jgi:phosphatidylglycerophosphatase A